jgi:hypothetical protein
LIGAAFYNPFVLNTHSIHVVKVILFRSFFVYNYITVKLGRKIVKAGPWLAIVIGIWLIVLITYLPIFHLVSFAQLKDFLFISFIMATLALIHYIGQAMKWMMERYGLPNNIQSFFDRCIPIMFDTVIFWLYFLTFLFAFIVALLK